MEIRRITGLVLSLLLASACQREAEAPFGDGYLTAEIVDDGTSTRTAYANEYSDDNFVWETGDRIAVFLSDGSTVNRYRVYELAPYGNNKRATFLCSTTSGLKRHYYAVYPSDAAVDNSYGQDASHPLKVTYATEYDIQGALNLTRALAPMVADNERVPASGEADLQFYHVGGLLRIRVPDLDPATQRIEVTFDQDVTGDYAVAFDSDGLPSVTTAGANRDNTVRFILAASGSSVGSSVTTAVLSVPVPCGEYRSVTVKMLNSAGTVLVTRSFEDLLVFDRHHGKKLEIRDVDLTPFTIAIASAISDIARSGADVMYDYSQNVTVTVNKTQGAVVEKSPWKAYFVPASGTVPAVGDDASSAWSALPLQDAAGSDWLALSAYEGSGNADAVTVSLAGAQPASGGISGTNATTMKNILRSGYGIQDMDLSTYDILTNTAGNACETANCYIIKKYGSYLIPCVYGNAFKGMAPNESAYIATVSGSADAPVLSKFLNADGKAILNPVITHDGNLTKSNNLVARVVWQDVAAGYEILTDDDVEFVAANGTAVNCPYIRVNFRKEAILPGNIVVALYDATNRKILWSWHLWVTTDSFSVTEVTQADGSTKNKILNEDLGWTPPITFGGGNTPAREQNVVIVSLLNDKVVDVFKVSQASYNKPGVGNSTYSNTYYQFGRKDPFLPMNGVDGNRTFTCSPDFPAGGADNYHVNYLEEFTGSADVRIGNMIKQPYVFNGGYGEDPKYVNLWNTNNNVIGVDTSVGNIAVGDVAVTKTVYDPCPRGFQVPRKGAFTGFTSNGVSQATAANVYGSSGAATGEFPPYYNLTTNHSSTASTYKVKMYMTGYRYPYNAQNGNSTNTPSHVYTIGTHGYFWSAAPISLVAGHGLVLSPYPSVSPVNSNYRTDGRTVRPAQIP